MPVPVALLSKARVVLDCSNTGHGFESRSRHWCMCVCLFCPV